MKKKLLSVLLSTAMVATLLAGCGGSSEPAATEEPAAEETTEAPAEEPAEEEAAESAAGERETTVRREGGIFYVEGKWLYNFMGQINFDDYQSLSFFSRVLQKNGVIDLLREHGCQDGDTVNIYDFEFEYQR